MEYMFLSVRSKWSMTDLGKMIQISFLRIKSSKKIRSDLKEKISF